MKLIVVTPPDYFEGEGVLINQFFAAGLDLLHVRKPESNTAQFRKLMMEIKPEYYPAISIHQHHELADEFSLKRLHYTEQHRKSMNTVELERLFRLGFCLSSSIHDLSMLDETGEDNIGFLRADVQPGHIPEGQRGAEEMKKTENSGYAQLRFLDYVFFGPVFDSISKAGYQSVLKPDFVLPPHTVKVFAIGGVRADRLKQLQEMNFDGAAVLGSLWHQSDAPLTALKKLIEVINELTDDHR